MAVAIFSEEGKCYWRDYYLVYVRRLVRVRHLVRVRDENLRLWGLGPVLALNREDL